MTNFLKIYDIKRVISADIGTLNCNSTNFKKIREMKVVICTRDSTKVLKVSLSLKPGWMGTISELLKKYFTKEVRPTVRCTALQCLLQVYKSNKQIHEEEILKTLIIPFVSRVDEEVSKNI